MQNQLTELINTLKSNQRLHKLAISETGFLFDPQTGQSFTLNHTGLAALNYLKRGESIEDTANFLSEDFKVPVDVALNGVESFLLQLGRYI